MIKYNIPKWDEEEKKQFDWDCDLEQVIDEMSVNLSQKLKENARREAASIEYASKFITTP